MKSLKVCLLAAALFAATMFARAGEMALNGTHSNGAVKSLSGASPQPYSGQVYCDEADCGTITVYSSTGDPDSDDPASMSWTVVGVYANPVALDAGDTRIGGRFVSIPQRIDRLMFAISGYNGTAHFYAKVVNWHGDWTAVDIDEGP